jgi:hypothetical protein
MKKRMRRLPNDFLILIIIAELFAVSFSCTEIVTESTERTINRRTAAIADTSTSYLPDPAEAVEKGKDLISGVGDALGGVKEGATGLFGGLGNLVGNIFGGGASSLVGLIAAGMMLFGNFGWMGKVVCGLIAAMSFGLFGGQQAAGARQLAASPVRGQGDGLQQPLVPETEGSDEENGQVIYRPRR